MRIFGSLSCFLGNHRAEDRFVDTGYGWRVQKPRCRRCAAPMGPPDLEALIAARTRMMRRPVI